MHVHSATFSFIFAGTLSECFHYGDFKPGIFPYVTYNKSNNLPKTILHPQAYIVEDYFNLVTGQRNILRMTVQFNHNVLIHLVCP